MDIKEAKKLAYRDVVLYPENRGEPEGKGLVLVDQSNSKVYSGLDGKEYIFVSIRVDGKQVLWPSNRLSKA